MLCGKSYVRDMSDAVNQGTSGCSCEHASISRALTVVRLPNVSAWTDSLAPRENLPGVVLTWSSPEDLLLSPRWAWLGCPGVSVLQLPVGYQAIQTLFAQSPGPVRCPGAQAARTHVTGQFRWALDELGSRLGRAKPKELIRRLKELEAFANCHWPGWYAELLCEARRALSDSERDRAKALLDLAREVADEVAALQPLGPLFHGSAEDVVNGGTGPARAAIGGARSGALTPAQAQAVLRRNPWWDGLAVTLAACQQQLRDLAGEVADEVAGLQPLSPLFHGSAEDVVNGGAGPARAAIGGGLSGALTPAQVQAVLRRKPWWDGLGVTLAGCRQQLQKLAKADNQAATDIAEQVAEMQNLVDRFSAFAREVCQGRTGPARDLSGNWGAAQTDLGRLMDLVSALSQRREALRERMKEGQGLGQEVQD